MIRRDTDGTVQVEGPEGCCVLPSPTGFRWGYFGCGPADLALSIRLHLSGNLDWALDRHQDFKRAAVAPTAAAGGAIVAQCIRVWIKAQGGHVREEVPA